MSVQQRANELARKEAMKVIGAKEEFILVPTAEQMFGKPIVKGSKEHQDILERMIEDWSGRLIEKPPPEKYGGEEADFSVPEGTNVSFFTDE